MDDKTKSNDHETPLAALCAAHARLADKVQRLAGLGFLKQTATLLVENQAHVLAIVAKLNFSDAELRGLLADTVATEAKIDAVLARQGDT